MNDRIQELALQVYGTQVTAQEIKFAKLIGCECVSLADNMRDDLDEDGEKQQALGAAWVGLAITRHFGFEE